MAATSVARALCLVLVVLSGAVVDAIDILHRTAQHRERLARRHEQRVYGRLHERLQGAGERWEKLQKQAEPTSDGAMHWLRQFQVPKGNHQNGFAAQLGHLAVGAAGIAGHANPIIGQGVFRANPIEDPILDANDITQFLTLSEDQQNWLTAAAAAFNGLNAAAGGANLGGAILHDPFANCHQTIINALVVAGNAAGGNDRNKANAGLVLMGAAPSCYGLSTMSVGQIQALTAKIAPYTVPMTMAQMGDFLALTQDQQTWITQYHAGFTGLNPAAGGAVLPPFGGPGADPLATCHGSIVNGLAAAGAGANDRVKAMAWLGSAGMGRADDCKLNVALATIRGLTALWTNPLVVNGQSFPAYGWLVSSLALSAHYARFQQLLTARHGGQTFDIWTLRGWLYATDRAKGHRLMGASGWVDGESGAPQGDFEKKMLWTMDSRADTNTPTVGQTYGLSDGAAYNARSAIDTIGHVRPRSMGGQRDPLNFVPQSNVGQAMVQVAETIGLKLARHCASGVKNGRYTVVFEYPVITVVIPVVGARDLARRPSAAATTVDLLRNCAGGGDYFGGAAPVAPALGTAFFEWHGNTY